MAKRIEKLTDVACKVAGPGLHADGNGLYLRVAGPKSKSWLYLWRVTTGDKTKRYEMGLGSYFKTPLADARLKADEARRKVGQGGNPIEEKRQRKSLRLTFAQAAQDLINIRMLEWKNGKASKQAYQWHSVLLGRDANGKPSKEDYCQDFRDKLVSDITTEDVKNVVAPIWGIKTETASRLRARIEAVLDHAKDHTWQWAQGSPENPARLRLLKLANKSKIAKVEHHRAMPYAELPDFMKRLRGAGEDVSPLALEFLILTAGRTSEVIAAKPGEINWHSKVWTVPPARMKGSREHKVPLSARAVAILRRLQRMTSEGLIRKSAFLFPGQVRRGRHDPHLSTGAFDALLERMDVAAIATTHGFRSTFRDWAGDETNYPRDMLEFAIAHKLASDTEAAYRRSTALERRRKLMADWATYCGSAKARRRKPSNVIPLRRRAVR